MVTNMFSFMTKKEWYSRSYIQKIILIFAFWEVHVLLFFCFFKLIKVKVKFLIKIESLVSLLNA